MIEIVNDKANLTVFSRIEAAKRRHDSRLCDEQERLRRLDNFRSAVKQHVSLFKD